MSIRISHGHRYTTRSLVDLHSLLLGEFREFILAQQKKTQSKVIFKQAISEIDRAVNRGEEIPKRALQRARQDVRDRIKEITKTGYRDPEVDFDMRIFLIPFEGQVYGCAICEQDEWMATFYDQPWIERYPYWNNTDKPDDVSEEDWDERKRVWDGGIFGKGHDCLKDVSFMVDLTAPDPWFLDKAELFAEKPTLAKRTKRLAMDNIITLHDPSPLEMEEGESAESYSQKAMRRFFDAQDWLKTSEGKAAFKAEQERLKTILPPITEDLMFDGKL